MVRSSVATVASHRFVEGVRERVATVVVGQDTVVERLLIALFTGGHLLLQGMPGLAKTLLVNAIARAIDLKFARVQFTIDLLPSDIIGSEILDQRTSEFRVHRGPVFTNLFTLRRLEAYFFSRERNGDPEPDLVDVGRRWVALAGNGR